MLYMLITNCEDVSTFRHGAVIFNKYGYKKPTFQPEVRVPVINMNAAKHRILFLIDKEKKPDACLCVSFMLPLFHEGKTSHNIQGLL